LRNYNFPIVELNQNQKGVVPVVLQLIGSTLGIPGNYESKKWFTDKFNAYDDAWHICRPQNLLLLVAEPDDDHTILLYDDDRYDNIAAHNSLKKLRQLKQLKWLLYF
jgi:hypothetical protein